MTLALADHKGASAAVSAIMGKAKLHGLLVDKSQNDNRHRVEDPLAPLLVEIDGSSRSLLGLSGNSLDPEPVLGRSCQNT